MAKIIRFPLKMKKGIEVRTIEELRENFDMDAVLENYTSGKLDTWLRGRYYDNIANAIKALDDNVEGFYAQLCSTLGVEYQEQQHTSVSEAQYKQEKLQRFQSLECYDRYSDKFDQVAMNQQDLEILLKQGVTQVYLLENEFEIPLSYECITYTGVGNPIVIIRAEDNVNFKAKNLRLKNMVFGWDVSGVSEADEVFQAERLLMENNWVNALPYFLKHRKNDHPRAILFLELIYQSYQWNGLQRANIGNAGQYLHSVQSFVLGAENRLNLYLPVLKKLAEKGNPFDQYLYAYALMIDGKYNNNSYEAEEMIRYLKSSAEQGCSMASILMGDVYHHGCGFFVNDQKAFSWYEKAAKQGHPEGQWKLACCYESGKGVKQDYSKAYDWFTQAANQNNAVGQCGLGRLYATGKGINQNYAEAVKWYTKSAEQGYPGGQCALAYCYEKGNGVAQIYNVAIDWYRKAAEQGDITAQNAMGDFYSGSRSDYFEYSGVIEKDFDTAVKWYMKAAKQGDARGQYNLGRVYEGFDTHLYTGRDYSKAAEWYEKAAEQGHAEAQYRLSRLYKYGDGVPRDQEKALQLLIRASKGNLAATYDLALHYYIKKDYEKAVKLFRKGAEGTRRHRRSMQMLAECYEHGRGVSRDYSQASSWYRKAGDEKNAKRMKKRAGKELDDSLNEFSKYMEKWAKEELKRK